MTTLEKCRLCKSVALTQVIDLGEQYITSRFPNYGDWSTPKIAISLSQCNDCFLIQTSQTTAAADMYEHEYGYRSGISNTMRAHLQKYQQEILGKVNLEPDDAVLDIGSNDSTMLQYYDTNLKRIGIDPTGNQFKEYYGKVELIPTYFTKANFQKVYGSTRCKIVSSISMFYDLPDPVQFATDIHDILDDEGIWTCEQSYLLSMLESNSIDTICHEHLEYYAIRQIKEIADRAGFKIIDVSFNDCNGGSSRVYFAKKSSQHKEVILGNILAKEEAAGLYTINAFVDFMERVNTQVKRLTEFIDSARKEGKETWVYGASTKGNCLLQYANLGESSLRYAVERNPQKVGKMTATGIPIISEETMRSSPPAYLLVLPWHFRTEIIERESAFLKTGGLIFPFPEFTVVRS
jgi:NDP-4-keto-2,6-dideoxyhexose 3-C-methyltransferase